MKGHLLQVESTLRGGFPYLLLPQDEDPSWFDGMPGREIQARPPQHTILVGLPLSITGGPGHAHVVPFSIVDRQRQCHGLWVQQGTQTDGCFLDMAKAKAVWRKGH